MDGNQIVDSTTRVGLSTYRFLFIRQLHVDKNLRSSFAQLDRHMWRTCTGPSHTLPNLGPLVMYFANHSCGYVVASPHQTSKAPSLNIMERSTKEYRIKPACRIEMKFVFQTGGNI